MTDVNPVDSRSERMNRSSIDIRNQDFVDVLALMSLGYVAWLVG